MLEHKKMKVYTFVVEAGFENELDSVIKATVVGELIDVNTIDLPITMESSLHSLQAGDRVSVVNGAYSGEKGIVLEMDWHDPRGVEPGTVRVELDPPNPILPGFVPFRRAQLIKESG